MSKVIRRIAGLLDKASSLPPERALSLVVGACQEASSAWVDVSAHNRQSFLALWGRCLYLHAHLRDGPVVVRLLAEAAEKYRRVLEEDHEDELSLASLAIIITEQAAEEDADTATFLVREAISLHEAYSRVAVISSHSLREFGRAYSALSELVSGDVRRQALMNAAEKFHSAYRREPRSIVYCSDWAVTLASLYFETPIALRPKLALRVEDAFRRAHELSPADPHVLAEFGSFLMNRGFDITDKDEGLSVLSRSVEFFEKAVDESRGSVDCAKSLGVALSHRASWETEDRAQQTLKRALEIFGDVWRVDPSQPELAFNRGYTYFRLGEVSLGEEALEAFKAAADCFEQAVTQDPEDAESWAEWGAVLVHASTWTDDDDEALELLVESISRLGRSRELGLQDSRLYFYLGTNAFERALRDHLQTRFLLQEACDHFENAAAFPLVDEEVFHCWARTLAYLSEHIEGDLSQVCFSRAEELFDEAKERAPWRYDILFNQAIALRMRAESLPDHKQGIELLWRAADLCRRAIESSPDEMGFTEELDYIQELLGAGGR